MAKSLHKFVGKLGFKCSDLQVDPERDIDLYCKKFVRTELPKQLQEEKYQESDEFTKYKQLI